MNIRSDDIRDDDGLCEVTEHDEGALALARAAVPADEHLKRARDLFDALGDDTRLRIVAALARTELCVCDLAQVAGVSESAVSHQLRLLRNLDLVTFHRQGKRAVYRLADECVRDLLSSALGHVAEGGGVR